MTVAEVTAQDNGYPGRISLKGQFSICCPLLDYFLGAFFTAAKIIIGPKF